MMTAARLLDDVANFGKAFLGDPNDGEARLKLVAAAEALTLELYTPFEFAVRIGWGEASRTAAVRVAVDLGLLKKLSDEPQNSEQLAAGTVADPVLVARIFKHLAATGIVREVGRDSYVSTRFSRSMNDPDIRVALQYTCMTTIPTFASLPEFLAKTNYQNPKNGEKCALQHALGTKETFFGLMRRDAGLGAGFNQFLRAYASSVPSWTDMYPVRERLGAPGLRTSSPLLVDVGGNLGHQLADLHRRFPDLRGGLVLQDQADIVAAAEASGQLPPPPPGGRGVTTVAHDFFTAQPASCRGARAYYLRLILHDWPDEQCGVILSHLRDAMAPGYSRLIINDLVLPDRGASWRQTSLDMVMMALLVSQERTESQWRALLEGAGLRMSGVWHKEGESVIEAVLATD
ncbi:hypothetical protein JDV02_006406 [Purpureocillium takamizusanense]|uniref:O-methyltransferase C-terminal domain-containing protein n=1 Tax=Purpureocillium takamizusanense TaxID=2060973 RepID=A0A9Q8QJG5_9HYPO|nr:uncharacterized protein JDV02_006406 [Purpureocillium takamizusanense]UNI20306.1 hypothetical protein JDV02_006406 [Purpureocillium takamizusanense]